MKANPMTLLLIAAAIVSAVLAVLYGIGAISFFTSEGGHIPHLKHALLFGGVAVICLIGVNFARRGQMS
jgi:hypothetical protein